LHSEPTSCGINASREHGHDLTDWLRAEREIKEWHQQKLRGGNSPTPTEKALVL